MMSRRGIDATNVVPAYEASLLHGATEKEIEEHVGWRRDHLLASGTSVSGESTYQHMELMATKPRYEEFVLAAVERHNASSLGAVGLACRSCSSVAEAFACHGRFQHLTNRTAEYVVTVEDDKIVIVENRFGEARPGSLLISDYTMLIAVHLLRSISAVPPKVHRMKSRRDGMARSEQDAYEAFLDAPVELGADAAQIELGIALLSAPVVTADEELAEYFESVLLKALGAKSKEPDLLRDVKNHVGNELVHGAPTAAEAARALGLGQRTLQRRLSELGKTYAEVVEETRLSMADALLSDPRMSVGEVAYLLGYTEQTSFYRAFRRWHATTPAAYRKEKYALD